MLNCKDLIGLEKDIAIFKIVIDNPFLYKIVQEDSKYSSEDIEKSILTKIYLAIEKGVVTNAYYDERHINIELVEIDEELNIVEFPE